jgi:hypothetical protein
MTSVHDPDPADALGELGRFRREFYECVTARADAVFELTDAVLCADGPVRSFVQLPIGWCAPPGPRVAVCGAGPGSAGCAAAAAGSGRCAVAACGWWPVGVGGRCQLLAAAGRAHQPGTGPVSPYGRGKDQHIMIPDGRTRLWLLWRPATARGLRRWTWCGYHPVMIWLR